LKGLGVHGAAASESDAVVAKATGIFDQAKDAWLKNL